MRILKWLLIFICIIVIALIIGLTYLVTSFDANRLKSLIKEEARESLNSELTLAGDLHWSFFPNLALHMTQIELGNPAGFSKQQPFAKLKQIKVTLALLPLLKKKIVIPTLILEGLQLNLETHQQQSNWQKVLRASPPSTPKKSATSLPAKTDHNQGSLLQHLFIGRIRLEQASISYKDEDQHYRLQDLHLQLKHFTAASTAQFELSTIIHQQQQQYPISLQGEVTLKPQQLAINLDQLRLQDSKTQGSMTINLAKQQLDFNLHIDKLLLDPWIKDAPVDSQKQNAVPTQSNSSQPATNSTRHATQVPTFKMTGQLAIDEIHWHDLTITKFSTPITFASQSLRIGPMQALVDQGQYQGQLTFHLPNQRWEIQQKLNHFATDKAFDMIALQTLGQLAPYLNQIPISGTINLNSRLQGQLGSKLLTSLHGDGHLTLTGGSFQSFGGGDLIESGFKFLNNDHNTSTKENNKGNIIAKLTASFQIQNGILHNEDLQLVMPNYRIDGQGQINFPNNQIHYQLIGLKTSGGGALQRTPIPILVTGPLNDAHARLNVQALIKKQFQSRQENYKDKIKSSLKKHFKKLF